MREFAMYRGARIYLCFVVFVCLSIAIGTNSMPSRMLRVVSLATIFAFLLYRHPANRWWNNPINSVGPRFRGYRPRPTDAGQWVEAPIAEVDKSTFGKLLASRMQREPRLNVVVRGRDAGTPPVGSDSPLYDAELDG
jgi:hypothetical protein